MARILTIDDMTREQIKKCMAEAEARPVSFEALRETAFEIGPDLSKPLKLEDRKQGPRRPQSPFVMIPFGYRASFSIEDQPAGLCQHLSISVDAPKRLPNEPSVKWIAQEFGIEWPPDHLWIEEFAPEHHAINILKLWKPKKEGHA